MVKVILEPLLKAMPFLFGIGFLAPLIREILTLAGVTGPNLAIGLIVGGGWGAVATLTGRWI